jgi:hypothetical protein
MEAPLWHPDKRDSVRHRKPSMGVEYFNFIGQWCDLKLCSNIATTASPSLARKCLSLLLLERNPKSFSRAVLLHPGPI